ncbi:hypothetical protein NEA10_20730 (plasmid) [Phormidium yuhuli AB48]|uniref:Uncharacterized protein n=1 Tax=Phormidium yuhuli AB48 TaxID=2940671 RepID=A0ABY5AVJ8_9CYAN|nr:hypothetical protein [Phormidium yuhuli]USR93272.1 hypothetical protein NEA10_20730 [Phormidium yuhuli AB48]
MFTMTQLLFSATYIRHHKGSSGVAGDNRIARHAQLIWEEMEHQGTRELFVWDFNKFCEQSVHWDIMKNDNILYNQKWCEKHQSQRVTNDWSNIIVKLLEMAIQFEEDLQVELNQKYEPSVLGDDNEF